MKRIPLHQGSKEWLDWRKDKITATDASIIMDANPYPNRNILNLWREKLDNVISAPPNEAMLRGQELEPIARSLFIEETGIYVEPLVGEHEEFYWMGASFDGVTHDGLFLIEIKCPKPDTHLLAIDGGILPLYKVQMQHQMAVADIDQAYYVSYNPTCNPKFHILEYCRDNDYINMMMDDEKYFFEQCMSSMEDPRGKWHERKSKRNPLRYSYM